MKTQVLLSMVLLGLTSATITATTAVNQGEDYLNTTRYRYAEPITFIERGVEFLIFPDGSFDFNTNLNTGYEDVYYRGTTTTTNRRGSVNTTYGIPRNEGVLVQHDNTGKVRRIGNIFINYDREGRIKRAGTVYMTYNRGNGRLIQVGGLRVNYNAWGEIAHTSGHVNHFNSHYQYGVHYGSTGGTVVYNDHQNFEDYYYYRVGTEVKTKRKLKK